MLRSGNIPARPAVQKSSLVKHLRPLPTDGTRLAIWEEYDRNGRQQRLVFSQRLEHGRLAR